MCIFDLDRFKSVNDRFGHAAGDKVLHRVAQLVKSQVRSTDYLFRWGGEEFLIILPETTLESASQVAERIRAGIQDLRFETSAISTTASQGMTAYRPEEVFAATISRADNALAKAKFLGRNRIEST